MAKISYTSFVILAILVFSAASSMVMKVDAQQKGHCQVMLYPDNCVPAACNNQCVQKFKGGDGECIGISVGRDVHFGCSCVYPC
ncbi:defensin-like protein 149 [Macadamia integrifolia]|uniref:defensin-like protein 149 n=1 Tax=Macadamia integrifolia TaxID=60698 RepID=UPI001C4F6D55|nr:defensin-like protein 149 [Macadamia integrifolia]